MAFLSILMIGLVVFHYHLTDIRAAKQCEELADQSTWHIRLLLGVWVLDPRLLRTKIGAFFDTQLTAELRVALFLEHAD
jgi:hypothetical protein